MKWTRFNTADAASYSEAEKTFEQIKANVPQWHLRNHLGWVSQNRESGAITILALEKNGEYIAYALLLRQKRPLSFQIGEIKYAHKKLTRYELWAEPVFAENKLTEAEKRQWARALLLEIHTGLKEQEALSIEGLRKDSYFLALLLQDKQVRQTFITLQLGKPFAHQFINMPPTIDDYLGQMGKGTLKTLKYGQRKLNKDFQNVETRCFESQDSVDTFLDDAIAISKKTYQWRLLGLGLRHRKNLRKSFDFAAGQGWLRHYILYVDNHPVAFMLGYQYDDCYYYTDVGFDPDWGKWSVGSVLQLSMIEDLYSREDTPVLYDFSTGYGHHKAQFGNFSQDEVNLLILPNTLFNRLLVQMFKFNEWFEATSVSILERIGLKKFLKKLIRANSS